MLILQAVIAENRNDSRASKTCISKINFRLLIAPIKVVDYKIAKFKEEIIFEIVRFSFFWQSSGIDRIQKE